MPAVMLNIDQASPIDAALPQMLLTNKAYKGPNVPAASIWKISAANSNFRVFLIDGHAPLLSRIIVEAITIPANRKGTSFLPILGIRWTQPTYSNAPADNASKVPRMLLK